MPLRQPQFVVIGARKCGTTWLDASLRTHPRIYLPRGTKELFFFDRYFERGTGWYGDYFADASPRDVIGEVTPSYFSSEAAPGRLARVLPDAKLVLVLRDPVLRAWSDYRHAWRKGDVGGSGIQEAVEAMPSILRESRYHEHVSRWLECVPRERFRALGFEELMRDPVRHLQDLCAWLGVPDPIAVSPGPPSTNVGVVPRGRVLTAVAHGVSRGLHRMGLHSSVRAAKRWGGDSLVFRPERSGDSGPAGAIDAASHRWLHERLADVPRATSELLPSVDVSAWGRPR